VELLVVAGDVQSRQVHAAQQRVVERELAHANALERPNDLAQRAGRRRSEG
jgi:hypothetical protein